MKTRANELVNDRPHPGPLPQERGKGVPSHDILRVSFYRTTFSEPTEDGERQAELQANRIGRWLSPLPGGEGQGEGGRNH